ncbi:MAG: nitroreductase family protein [Desulfatibacillum sp.]|nr:nitroreductase family protein [Desulfatibacillum sp.]
MDIIAVDPEKCNRDGICVTECPVAGISFPDRDAVPAPGPGLEQTCLGCGHCVAVCPTGALTHRDVPLEDCPEIRKDLVINQDQAEQFLRSRRSIRVYKDKSAPREVLQQLVDMAHYAPTAHNDQEVHFTVIEDKEEVKMLTGMVIDWMRATLKADKALGEKMFFHMFVGAWDMGFDALCRSAPHMVLAHTEHGKSPFSHYYPVDCASALAYLELAAPTLGLGTYWNGMFMAAALSCEPLRKALNLPKDHRLNGVLMLGYPKFKYHRLPKRKEAPVRWSVKDSMD